MDTNYIYQIIFHDDYNDLIHTGFYDNLKSAIDGINQALESYELSNQLDEGVLIIHKSTYRLYFDTELYIGNRNGKKYITKYYDEIDEIENELTIHGFVFEGEIKDDKVIING